MAKVRQDAQGNLAADGDSDTAIGRGSCAVILDGDFGSGTITVNHNVNGSFVPVTDDTTDVTFTADGSKRIDYPDGALNEVKLTLASSSSPDLNYRIVFDRG